MLEEDKETISMWDKSVNRFLTLSSVVGEKRSIASAPSGNHYRSQVRRQLSSLLRLKDTLRHIGMAGALRSERHHFQLADADVTAIVVTDYYATGHIRSDRFHFSPGATELYNRSFVSERVVRSQTEEVVHSSGMLGMLSAYFELLPMRGRVLSSDFVSSFSRSAADQIFSVRLFPHCYALWLDPNHIVLLIHIGLYDFGTAVYRCIKVVSRPPFIHRPVEQGRAPPFVA